MASIATAQFLASLKAAYPAPQATTSDAVVKSSWYIVAAVAFSASRKPYDAAAVFQYALNDLKAAQETQDEKAIKEQLYMARRVREAILQAGVLSGAPTVRDLHHSNVFIF